MWKPKTYPDAKVLIADPGPNARRIARDCLATMKIYKIAEISDMSQLTRVFWESTYNMIIVDCDMDPDYSAETIEMLSSVDALRAFSGRVLLTMHRANERAISKAIKIGISSVLVKPYATRIFCEYAQEILDQTCGKGGVKPPVRKLIDRAALEREAREQEAALFREQLDA
jgi:DNA-binding NtrC family response regulator